MGFQLGFCRGEMGQIQPLLLVCWLQWMCQCDGPKILMDCCLSIGEHVKSFGWMIQRVWLSLELDCFKQKLTITTHSPVLQLQMMCFWDSPQRGVDSCLGIDKYMYKSWLIKSKHRICFQLGFGWGEMGQIQPLLVLWLQRMPQCDGPKILMDFCLRKVERVKRILLNIFKGEIFFWSGLF
jgi:hypothetical protein